ncbi:MAG TPA: M36 family metallopeptidase [Polyangiaceae bacterium]|nr:M36 family metallopeptidase [Polyangiaceae bacterium]
MRSYLTSLGSLAVVGGVLAGFSCSAHDTVKTSAGGYVGSSEAELATARAALRATPLGKVVARNELGSGRYVVASPAVGASHLNLSPESAARLHLERHARMLGLSETAVRGAVFKSWHSMSGGAGVALFEQRVNGIEVFRARASVLVDAANQLVSISNSMAGSGAPVSAKVNAFALAAEDALAAAYTAHAGVPLSAQAVRDQGELGSARSYAVTSPSGALGVVSATAKKVFFPVGGTLEAGYYIEILGRAAGSRENDARGYVIAADNGRILHEQSLTMHDAFNYRVWAEPTGLNTPLDGPITDTTPHPTGLVDAYQPKFVEPVIISMEGFNTNPDGKADPWLKTDDTFTFGNNVYAYSDRNGGAADGGIFSPNNGFQDGGSDLRAEVTGPRTFDRIYDLKEAPNVSPDQIKASITQLFYTNNWLHDFWYDSGFNEAANNAQLGNYGRGGVERDPLLVEAQDAADSGQSNNANMSPLADGTSPRMQMYVWTGIGNRSLVTTPPLTFTDGIGASGYGPQTFELTNSLILADDGSTAVMAGTTGIGTVTDACQTLPATVSGKIVVADRGGCNFTVKSVTAQAAGAVGVILLNNAAGNAPTSPSGADTSIKIPLLGLSLEDGAKLKAALAAGPVSAVLNRGVETMRDGTIDNTIVAHEWGHYLHHRLVQCSSASCNGMSEGWGDFVAVLMSVREGDTFDNGKTYALSQYATAGFSRDGAYFGIRRAPYSKSKAKNPFTFGHISQKSALPMTASLAPAGADLSEVHNVGEIWAEALFEAYTNLIEAGRAANPPVPFAETQRRMADYVVAGMKTAPAEPTFVEQRDSILAAVYATKRMDDFSAIAKGFADRGLGVSAVAPPTTSTNLNEAVENFDFKGRLAFVNAKVDDSSTTCDRDGNLDANESGKLNIEVRNAGWLKLTNTQVKATTTNPDITFANGGATEVVSVDPFGTAKLSMGITAKAGATKRDIVPIVLTMTDGDAINPSSEVTFRTLFNLDEVKETSATDDVESNLTVWTMTHMPTLTADAWSRDGDATNHLWHADDVGVAGDESLVSPDLSVGSDPFTISFRHRFSFELASLLPGLPGMFPIDGGVLEISVDGAEWQDITQYATYTYPSTISANVLGTPNNNVLAGRRAWAAVSAGYATNQFVNVSLDLGTKVAGKKVKVRFRVGTDEATGAPGWDIDDIAFGGITNKPFGTVADQNCSPDAGVSDGGAGDATGTGDAGGSAGAGGGTTSDGGCSCSIPRRNRANGMAAVGALGALAAMLGRRRWRRGA